jgi:hypothetical protein
MYNGKVSFKIVRKGLNEVGLLLLSTARPFVDFSVSGFRAITYKKMIDDPSSWRMRFIEMNNQFK